MAVKANSMIHVQLLLCTVVIIARDTAHIYITDVQSHISFKKMHIQGH